MVIYMYRTIAYISTVDTELLNNIVPNIDREGQFNNEQYLILKE